ncbi:putative Spindle pole body-associated protein sad1 [Glarea lozoyensis 74030]|uniref:Putative Spindle pole body-associated protein sad1 n=1 Tax=Glarea lozoyensis (strain ATCC 74030 / MF5533) TaxID=1104152 RepID=H0EIX3_GLAL7|nr:putative Spindle pole body-associated protein sad1 [Glarea lozoyensis 74030]
MSVRRTTPYGKDPLFLATTRAGRHTGQVIESVLGDLLEPVREDATNASQAARAARNSPAVRSTTGRPRGRPSKQPAQSSVDPDRTFGEESNLFGAAGFDTSSVNQSSDQEDYDDLANERKPLSNVYKPLRGPLQQPQPPRAVVNQQTPKPIATQHRPVTPKTPILQKKTSPANNNLNVPRPVKPSWEWRSTFDSVHQYLKDWLLQNLDYKYSYLKRKTEIDEKTISRIEKSLPDFLVVRKNDRGKMEIPLEFWGALRDLILSDGDLLPSSAPPTVVSTGEGVSMKEFEKKADQLWQKYIKENQAKITSWSSTEFEEKFPHLFKKHILASKSEIVDMIRHSWKDNNEAVKQELSTLSKKLDKARDQIIQLQDTPSSMSSDKLKAMISNHINNILPIAQLEALISANVKGNVNWGLSRVNHWSHGTGAVINILMTSPNYAFPSMNQWTHQKLFRWFIGNPVPTPNPPEAALTKWDEHGECWCSPAKHDNGFGPTIGVISGSDIFPDQVVVEHISPSASLEPGAAPREMELYAYIENFDTYDAVSGLSKEMFGEPDSKLKYHYVKVAEWTYNAELGSNSAQAFNVAIDLKQFSAPTNKLVVRAKNNWGGDSVEYTCLYRIRVHGEIAVAPKD